MALLASSKLSGPLGLIKREDFEVKPPKVEYSLSSEGQSLIPVISVMYDWGMQHLVKGSTLKKLGIKCS